MQRLVAGLFFDSLSLFFKRDGGWTTRILNNDQWKIKPKYTVTRKFKGQKNNTNERFMDGQSSGTAQEAEESSVQVEGVRE